MNNKSNSIKASKLQQAAADPTKSIQLRASAGSGKTKVLIDRIVRLLLRKEQSMKRVVALTFTKKAAAEIQNRLLKKFKKYLLLPDAELEKEIIELTGEDKTEIINAYKKRAKTLYGEFLDDQSGLQIGTIASWCQGLLNRFADEANIDPHFKVLEDTDLLWDEAVLEMESELSDNKDALDELIKIGDSVLSIKTKLSAIFKKRIEIDRWCDRVIAEQNISPVPQKKSDLFHYLLKDLNNHVFENNKIMDIDSLLDFTKTAIKEFLSRFPEIEIIEADPSKKFNNNIEKYRNTLPAILEKAENGDPSVIDDLKLLLLTSGKLRVFGGRNNTKEECQNKLSEIAGKCLEAIVYDNTLALVEQNAIQLKYGLKAIDIYDKLKQRDRVLDFHDLERKAQQLFQHPDFEISGWIQYRTDEGIEHVLIDEFQDTNRVQWDILEPVTQEIIANYDTRTMFLVGDIKQSIYRFRGACPEIFIETETNFSEKERIILNTNFRTTEKLVETVGKLFETPPLKDYLPENESDHVKQDPFRNEVAGKVCFHEFVQSDNLDECRKEAADRVVKLIQQILADEQIYDDDKKEIRQAKPKDILILTRSRTSLRYYENALNTAKLPFVPGGRGSLALTCEVKDILNLLRWLKFRDDDSALAGVLNSPIFRLSQKELQSILAHKISSNKTLWDTLFAMKETWPLQIDLLSKWLGLAKTENSHALLRNILETDGMFQRFNRAIGEQAEYNLMRLYDLAVEYDQSNFPTIRGFIKFMERAQARADKEEGSLPETEKGRIKILTIHQAKGLESPVVIYVDAAQELSKKESSAVLPVSNSIIRESGPLINNLNAETNKILSLAETPLSKTVNQLFEQGLGDSCNLLYVALTRARDVLHVIGSEKLTKTKKIDPNSHLHWIQRTGAELVSWDNFETDNIYSSHEPDINKLTILDQIETDVPLYEVVSPSSEQLKKNDDDFEIQHSSSNNSAETGTKIHQLLEIATETGAAPTGSEHESLEVASVFNNPKLKWVFDADEGYNEIPVIHKLDEKKVMYGIIDRLIVDDNCVHIIDYKSSINPESRQEELKEKYRPQMSAYKKAMEKIYQEKEIKTWLLFTKMNSGELVEIA